VSHAEADPQSSRCPALPGRAALTFSPRVRTAVRSTKGVPL